MKPITFLSVTAYLLDTPPDWVAAVQLNAELPANTELGLTAIETRRTTGDTLRLSLNYQTYLERADLPIFRNSMQAISTEKVLCPLWCYPFEAGATPLVTAAYYVLIDGIAAPEIKTHAQLPFAREAYPLLVGRLSSMTQPHLLHDECAQAQIQFVENGDYPITCPAITPEAGPRGDGSMFPWRPNWLTPPMGATAEMPVDRKTIGNRRDTADAYYEQPARRPAEATFTLQDLEPWQLLRFLQDYAADRFWLPAGLSDARLTQDVLSTDFLLYVDAVENRGDNEYVILDDLNQRTPLKLGDNGIGHWQINGPAVGVNYYAERTRIESLLLARLEQASVSLSFQSAVHADADISFTEVPHEMEAMAGETIGTTHGRLPTLAHLYAFSIAYPGATLNYRFTNFERDLSYGGNTYTSKHFEHGDITEDISFERHDLDLKSRRFAGNPLNQIIPLTLEWPLLLDIYEADIAAGAVTAARRVFSGEIDDASNDGPFINATAKTMSSLLDRKVPRRIIQPGCNWVLFEPNCGLAPNSWRWDGTVTAWNSGTLELLVGSVARFSGTTIALPEHYFAGGYIVLGSGTTAQRRRIADSSELVTGNITFVLGAGFSATPVALAVQTHPGCDGQYATCVDKFANSVNNGGFPFVPAGNPSLVKVRKKTAGAGKK